MGRADYLSLGDWNSVCSMCGRKRKASEVVKNWQGMFRCPEHNESRQPQDFVRAVPDVQTPPWVQPPSDIDLGVCTLNTQLGIAGIGTAGCAIVGRTTPPYDPTIP